MLSRARQGPSPRWPLIGQQHLILTLSCEVALPLSPLDRRDPGLRECAGRPPWALQTHPTCCAQRLS